jgi:hypothetical protein
MKQGYRIGEGVSTVKLLEIGSVLVLIGLLAG